MEAPPPESELAAERAADWQDQRSQDTLIATAVVFTVLAGTMNGHWLWRRARPATLTAPSTRT